MNVFVSVSCLGCHRNERLGITVNWLSERCVISFENAKLFKVQVSYCLNSIPASADLNHLRLGVIGGEEVEAVVVIIGLDGQGSLFARFGVTLLLK